MTFEMPENLRNRSKTHSDRADQAGRRLEAQIAGSSRADRGGTSLKWEKPLNTIQGFFEQIEVIIASFAAFGIGATFFIASIFMGKSSLFILGFPLLLGGGIASVVIIKGLIRANEIDRTLLNHNLSIDYQQEMAINAIRANMSASEIQLAMIQAASEGREADILLLAAAAQMQGSSEERRASAEVSADIRRNQQELEILDKQVVLEQAKGGVRVDELKASADVLREELRVRHELEMKRVKEDLYAEQERFEREMKRLDNQNSQAAKMQRINEVTQLRKVLIASHAELRNNPALADQLTTMISEVDYLLESMQKKEPMTIEDHQRQELIDQMLTRFLLKRHNLDDDTKTA